MKTYLINLDRSIDRLEAMKIRLKTIGVDFERVSGIDGNKISPVDYTTKSPNARYPHHLSAGEIACFLSHKKCWELLIKSNEEWALILEDNCTFSASATRYLSNTNWIPEGCNLINFCNRDGMNIFADKSITLNYGNTLLRVKASPPIGTYAYFISRDAARVALQMSSQIFEPVDNFLFGYFSSYASTIDHWRLRGTIVKRCNNTKTIILGRSDKNRSLYALHAWRLFKKILYNYNKLKLEEITHYPETTDRSFDK